MKREAGLEPAAHLTCVGATCGDVDAVARDWWDAGIRHVVALRGDAPAGTRAYVPHRGGYAHAAELTAGLRRIGDFYISVGASPESPPTPGSPAAPLNKPNPKLAPRAHRENTQTLPRQLVG